MERNGGSLLRLEHGEKYFVALNAVRDGGWHVFWLAKNGGQNILGQKFFLGDGVMETLTNVHTTLIERRRAENLNT